jgi:hypothetical protein
LPDSGIVTGQRPSTGTTYTPVADQLRVNEPRGNVQSRFGPERNRQTEQQFGDMFGLSDIAPSLSNGQFIFEGCPRRLVDNERGNTDSMGYKNRCEVIPATYDGLGSWVDSYTHFRTVSKLKEWTDNKKKFYSLQPHYGAKHRVCLEICQVPIVIIGI